MKVSLEWLSDFLLPVTGAPLEPEAAAEALMRGGLPVEHIDRVGEDVVLDVEVTSNRSDCLSHIGIARELAALMNRPLSESSDLQALSSKEVPTSNTKPQGPDRQFEFSIQNSDEEICPQYIARVLRNVKIGPSPTWMVRRLETIGVRPINNVVDVTNYVMFELGQPLHAFDLDKLAGGRIIVRRARAGETITSIDGRERALTTQMLVIADAEKPVAIAGVMGGLESEVTPSTTHLLLESARFDPLSVRSTARALEMKSDSSYRFERGIDPLLPAIASRRAAELILQIAGSPAAAASAPIEPGAGGFAPRTILMRLDRMRRLLGTQIATDEAMSALKRLRLSPRLVGEAIEITPPSYRRDLSIEADVIEEVARVVGYDRIPTRDQISIVLTPPSPRAKAMEIIREELISAGYFEAVTFTFVSDLLAEDFVEEAPQAQCGQIRADSRVRKSDARLRPSILPGLLEAIRHNETRGTPGARFFETGSTFALGPAGEVVEKRRLALAGDEDLHGVRGVIESLLHRLNAGKSIQVIPQNHAGFTAGAAGRIEWGGQTVGHLGKIDQSITEKLSMRAAPAAAEIDLEALVGGIELVPQSRPLSKFPAVRRDLSLIVSDATPYEALEQLIRALALPDLEQVEYITTYRGKPLEKGQKSLTIALVFRSMISTLTSEQVEESVQKVIGSAKKQLSAMVRI